MTVELVLLSPDETAETLGTRLRAERLAQDLTQRSVASRAGLSVPTVQRMERDGSGTLTSFLAILSALGRTVDLEDVLAPRPASSLREALDVAPRRRRGSR